MELVVKVRSLPTWFQKRPDCECQMLVVEVDRRVYICSPTQTVVYSNKRQQKGAKHSLQYSYTLYSQVVSCMLSVLLYTWIPRGIPSHSGCHSLSLAWDQGYGIQTCTSASNVSSLDKHFVRDSGFLCILCITCITITVSVAGGCDEHHLQS